MIDYWEAIGRLATYKDLSAALLEILPYVEPLSPVFVNVDDTHTAAGFQIPESQYKDVQKFFNPVLAEGCMSLMAAGEIIRTYAFQSSRDAMLKLQSVIAQTVPELYGPSARYFITLGILIVDGVFRHNLQTQRTKAENLLARLSDPRDDSINNLAHTPDFETAAVGFSAEPWEKGCAVRLLFSEGHLHPVGVATGAWGEARKKLRATA